MMKVRIVKNTWTATTPYRGWVVVDEMGEGPLHPANCPFKTKKNAINAVKNGRFESWGVTGITNKRIPWPWGDYDEPF